MTAPAPPGRYLTIHQVKEVTTFSRTTVWRRVKDGTFPAPHDLGGQKRGWDEAEVAAWKASRQPSRTN